MPPLRILHVVPYYEHAWAYGGIPRLTTALTRALAARGHQVTVCTTDAHDRDSRVPRSDPAAAGVDVRVFPNISNRLAYDWQLFTPVGLYSHLLRTAASHDVAHLHACQNLPAAIAAHVLERAGVPYVISPNGTARPIERRLLLKRIFTATVGRALIPSAARVIAASEAEKRDLLALGVPDAKLETIPNPVDAREFDPLPDGRAFREAHDLGDAPLVLFLGKLTPRKEVNVLLRAFARLRQQEARLVIAGNDMGAGGAARALASDLGLGPQVRFVGLLQAHARLEALAAADVTVYPSRDEVFGLVPLESLLCGTPVVVSNDSGCGEVIGRVGGGHLVPPGDAATLAEAIASILSTPELWRTRVRTAGERVRQTFDAGAVSRQVENLYARVLMCPARRRKTA